MSAFAYKEPQLDFKPFPIVKLVGAREHQCVQVGNAFPPLLAELIGNNLLRAETSRLFIGNVMFQHLRKNIFDRDEG